MKKIRHFYRLIWENITKMRLFSRKAFKKNCDYRDIVPISFYTHPPEGDRDRNYRDEIDEI